MKVIVAKTAGFCKGVRDALEITLGAIEKRGEGETLCTFGPLIHNRQVLAMLEEKGVREEGRIDDCAGKKVVIRAHGIPPKSRQELHSLDARLLDATCKRVAKVHAVIKRHARRGYHTVIVGDSDHAEVIGLMGYTEDLGVVINRPEQVEDLPLEWGDKVLLVAQTTQNEEVFQEITGRFLERFPGGVVRNTICGSTHERQAEVRELCSQVEAMVIVGGLHSGNTVRLAEIARECGVPTYHVETEASLNQEELARFGTVGISAGASTPNWIIRNVARFLEGIEGNRKGFQLRLKRFIEVFSYGNVYVALGAAFLPYAVWALIGIPCTPVQSGMAACYAFAMHSLNIYLDRNAIQLNDPRRGAFYDRWRDAFTWTSVAAVFVALFLAAVSGVATFLAASALMVLGLIYAVPLFKPWRKTLIALKIKDIPTSKTFSIPIAWASIVVIAPHLGELWSRWELLYAFWIIFLMVLFRTILLDFLAVQGDRLVGRETFVVLFGEPRTRLFSILILGLLALSLLLGPSLGIASGFAYVMLAGVAFHAWCFRRCFRKRLKEDPVFETLVEALPIGIGLIGLLWTLL